VRTNLFYCSAQHWVAEGSNDILKENMPNSIEPGIYVPDVGAFRYSDTLLITKDGYENLTPYPTDIDPLTILGSKPFTHLRGMLVRKALGITSASSASGRDI